jgi:hypothetical protein
MVKAEQKVAVIGSSNDDLSQSGAKWMPDMLGLKGKPALPSTSPARESHR